MVEEYPPKKKILKGIIIINKLNMILKIIQEGDPILRLKTADIEKDYPNLKELIQDMIETMRSADGIGLAASQVGIPINLFVVDIAKYTNEEFPNVFINTAIISTFGDETYQPESCLSVPNPCDFVPRPHGVIVQYLDEKFNVCRKIITGMDARVVLHEYDHTQGVLITDIATTYL